MHIVRARPGPAVEVDLDGDGLTAWLEAQYALPGDEWLRLNLISAIGGQITGPSGLSDELADGIDRPLLKLLRASADAVLVGAASIRAGGYTLPRRGPLVAVTLTGDFAGHAMPDEIAPGRFLVVCPPSATTRVLDAFGDRVTVIPIDGDPIADPALLLAPLRAQGLGRIVCEGGGALASRLLAAGLVDEFCQSGAPLVTSPGAPMITGDVPLTHARLDLLLLDETDRTYARWGFGSVAPSAPGVIAAD